MASYQARIKMAADGGFYAYVVRVDGDGAEQVDGTYKGRHFSTLAMARLSTQKHIIKVLGGVAA